MAVILKIGDVDLSGYALQGKVKVKKEPVYDGNQFTNVYGQTVKTYLGDKISLNASFENLPASVAAKIQTACSGNVEITYLNPNETSVSFERPSTEAAVAWEEDEDTQYWSINIAADCPLLSGGL